MAVILENKADAVEYRSLRNAVETAPDGWRASASSMGPGKCEIAAERCPI